jgi:hypothetical protein
VISGALAVASKQTTAKAPQRGGLSLSGGSPTGYRRAVREIPNRVIAMRESNAPSPPVSQFAAITSSRRNNLPLRARQTVGRTQHVVYPLLPVGFMGRSQPRPHDASWCQHAAPSAVDVSRAGRRYSIPSPVDNSRSPRRDGASLSLGQSDVRPEAALLKVTLDAALPRLTSARTRRRHRTWSCLLSRTIYDRKELYGYECRR